MAIAMIALLDTLALPFMQRALLMAVVVGVLCAVISCHLVLRGQALMGDGIAHSVLPGVALAAPAGLPLVLGAFVSGLACALASGYVSDNSRIRRETALGVVFSGLFGLGVVLLTLFPTGEDVMHILFGNLLGVSRADILSTLAIAAPCLAFLLAKGPDLFLAAFDRGQARAIGIPVGLLDLAFLATVALAVVAALEAVGVVLVVAMLIGPGVTAQLLARRTTAMLAIAVASAVLAGVLGALASVALDAATGPAIVLAQALLFVAALAAARLRPAGRGAARQGARA
jgi:manganese/iron transport system permease protein